MPTHSVTDKRKRFHVKLTFTLGTYEGHVRAVTAGGAYALAAQDARMASPQPTCSGFVEEIHVVPAPEELATEQVAR